MKNDDPNHQENLGLTRFEAVCHVKNLCQQGFSLAEGLRQAAACPWPPPDGTYYSYRTLETWWYDYSKSGFQGLCGKRRVDAGKSRAVDEETGLWIIDRIEQNPNTSLSVLLRHWREHGHDDLPSDSSIRRFLKARGYDARSLRAGRLESGPQKAFEAPAPNDLWMVDFAHGPVLRDPEDKSLATRLCVLLDDHSRLIPFAAYYKNENTASFLHALKEAVLRRGVPTKLYTDQGKPFVNNHVRIVCANLDIRLLHAKPYHAWSKGKVERLIRTIQCDFEACLRLEGQDVHTLEELNTAFSRWISSTYHLRQHGSTGMSPHERFNADPQALRPLEEPEMIDPLFYTRTERVVRKDGTVRLGNKLYEVDLALRALKIQLRYDPVLEDRIEVWHQNRFHGVARPANLHLNSQQYNRDNYEH